MGRRQPPVPEVTFPRKHWQCSLCKYTAPLRPPICHLCLPLGMPAAWYRPLAKRNEIHELVMNKVLRWCLGNLRDNL